MYLTLKLIEIIDIIHEIYNQLFLYYVERILNAFLWSTPSDHSLEKVLAGIYSLVVQPMRHKNYLLYMTHGI